MIDLQPGDVGYMERNSNPTFHMLSGPNWSGAPHMTSADLSELRLALVQALIKIEDEMEHREMLGRVTKRRGEQ